MSVAQGIKREFRISFPETNIEEITNERIYNRSGIELVRGVCDGDDIVFGKCNSDCFSVTVANLKEDVVGKEMVVSVTCAGEKIKLGKFIVNTAPRKTHKNYKKIVAYDRMQLLNVNMASWYKAVLPNTDSAVTLKYFRDSFFAYLGLEQTEVTLINDDLVVRKTVDTNEISGIEIMQAVCEINGVFGHFTSEGKFDYISLGENEEMVVGAITADYEEYTVHPINRVQLRQEDGDIGYITGETSEQENAYIVTGNYLLYGMTNDELKVVGDRLLAKIQGITYVPATQELKGSPDARLGSSYMVATSDGSTVTSIILKHTLKGGQALRSTFEAVGNEYREEDIDGLPYQFKQLKGRYNKLSRTVDETVAELGKMDEELGEVSTIAKQTASYFESEVTQDGETLSRFTQKLGKFLFEGSNFAIITDSITIDGNVLTIGNGYIGGIKIGSEGLSSEDYTTLQIFKDGTGKFTNLYGNGKGFIYLKPKKNEEDEEAVIPYIKTQDGFHADYDSKSNMSANMHCDSAGYAHYGLVSGDMESSDEPAGIEMVLKPDGAYIQSGDGVLKPVIASNIGGCSINGIILKSDNYSFDEKVIGRWVDGKPLYQKTFEFSKTITGFANIWVSTGIDSNDMECIVNTIALMIGNNGHYEVTHGYIGAAIDQGVVKLISARDAGLYIDALTLQYTKKTDISGEDLPGYIHYSTEETIIGTWIDGKPLYQKTWVKNDINIPANKDTVIGTIPGMENTIIRDTSGVVIVNGNARFLSLCATASDNDKFITYMSDNGEVVMISSIGWKVSGIELTVRYTKQGGKAKIIWRITKTRSVMSAQNILQLSELYLYDSNGDRIDISSNSKISITGITGTGSDSQTVDKIIDNDTSTKLCAYTGSKTDVVDVTITIKLDGDIDIASYSYFTSEDAIWRDPVSWEFTYNDSSGNSKNSIVDNANITTSRNSETDKFELS